MTKSEIYIMSTKLLLISHWRIKQAGDQKVARSIFSLYRVAYYASSTAAWAAAKRAMGTRNGEHET